MRSQGRKSLTPFWFGGIQKGTRKELALHTACKCVVGPQNVKDYLAFDKVLACDGTWMVKDALINGGEFEKIKEMTKEAVDIVK